MTPWFRVPVLAAAFVAAGAALAHSADLSREYDPPRHGSAYDDPRYADLYGDTPVRPERRYTPPRPYPGYGYAPTPREPVYRDLPPRYEPPRYEPPRYEPPTRYSYAHPRDRAYTAGPRCLHRDEVRHELERDGWRDFQDPQVLDQGTAMLTARRNGRLFQLKVDRCSGDVLSARALDGYRPYAGYGHRWYR